MLDCLELHGVLLLGGAQVRNRSEKGYYHLSSYIFGQNHCIKHDTAKGSWCRRIRHMWLGDMFLEALEVDEVRPIDGTLDGLVVLFISPRVLIPEHSELLQDTFHLFEEKASGIAESIADQGFPALRVIVIGEYRFWIEIKESRSRIWPLAEAMRDTKQADDIAKYLTRTDWLFFTPPRRMATGKSVASLTFRKLHGVSAKTPAGYEQKAGIDEQESSPEVPKQCICTAATEQEVEFPKEEPAAVWLGSGLRLVTPGL